MSVEGPPGPEQEIGEQVQIADQIKERTQELEPQMLALYEDFHRHPELGGQEVQTAAKIKEHLQKLGIEIVGEGIGINDPERGYTGTGIVAMIYGKEGGPTIALRADMDALPIAESTDHPLRSESDGKMHACGHDTHTAALLGAAQILQERAQNGELNGNVILLFQPSEESAFQQESGAVQMVKHLEKSGLREKISAFFGIHVIRELPCGTINVKEGVQQASSGDFTIRLEAPGGHIMNAYQLPNLNEIFAEITTRLAEHFRPLSEERKAHVASSATKFEGASRNVLAPKGEAIWVVRIMEEDFKPKRLKTQQYIEKTVNDVLRQHNLDGKVKIAFEPRPGYRPVIHRDKELVALAQKTAEDVIPGCKNEPQTSRGGEDFAFYGEPFRGRTIPSVFLHVGGASPQNGIPVGAHHTPDFQVDPGVIKDMAAIHAEFALNAIEHFQK